METEGRTLYIGNIDKDVTEEILYELFLQAGPIERVSIPSCRNDAFRYGFVTYKHEVSIDYSIELFKGTNLFRKEINIKRKGTKSNDNGQPSSDFNMQGNSELRPVRQNLGIQGNLQNNLLNMQQFLLQDAKYFQQSLMNVTANSLKGNWSSRNKPYEHFNRNYAPRPREPRDRRKDRDFGKTFYRKNRHRD